MGEQLTPAEDKDQRVEDIDTAKEMAYAEAPIRRKMQLLIEVDVPKEIVEKEFGTQLDSEAEITGQLYEQAKSVVNKLLIDPVKNPAFDQCAPVSAHSALSRAILKMLNRRVGENKNFSIDTTEGSVILTFDKIK